MKYIAIDLGSTYTKVADIINGNIYNVYQERTPEKLGSDPDTYEIDADVYFCSVYKLLSERITSDTIGILFSTQMHGYVLTKPDFSPITPYISWQDRQGALYLDEIRKLFGNSCTKLSGVPLKGNLALCSLLSRMRNGMVIPRNALFNTLGGYMIGRLTAKHVCHMTNAAPTGLADIVSGGWNHPLIYRTGLDGLVFPFIEVGLSPVGSFQNIPVYPDIGDQQMCALGAGLIPDNTLHINIGTAGLIGYLTKSYMTGDYETRPWITPDEYLLTVSGLPGGRSLYKTNVLLQELTEKIIGLRPEEDKVWKFMSEADDIHGVMSLDELFVSEIDRFIPTVMDTVANAYLNAASRMRVNIDSLAFSGGCIEKNPALRRAIESAFLVKNNGSTYDVMAGMTVFTQMLGGVNV